MPAPTTNRVKLRKLLVALDPSEKNNVATIELAERVDAFLKIRPRNGVDGLDGRDGRDGVSRDGKDGKDGVDGLDGQDVEFKSEIKKIRK